jgi:hypothetical protein
MISVVYLCSSAPNPMAEDLIGSGYQVFEALAVSEVLYLCEHNLIDAILIAADVEDPDLVEAQVRHMTLKLKPGATVKDVIWELQCLFREWDSSMQ